MPDAIAPEPVAAPVVAPSPSPAPAPSPAPSPSTAPTPAATPEPAPGVDNPFNDVFAKAEAHIQKMDADLKPAKVEPKAEVKVEPKTEVKTDPKPKPGEKPKSEQHKLRDELDARTAELTTTRDTLTKLESKLKELETKGQDTEKVMSRIGQLEKEKEDLAKEKEQLSAKLKVVKLEEDPEFQREHDQKFNRAAELAKDFVERLTVKDENGQPIRKFQWNEFVKIWHQFKDDPESAIDVLGKMVGERSATMVIPKMDQLKNIELERNEKLAEARTKAKEMQAQEEAQAATERQKSIELRANINRDLQERNPDFKLDPTDAELLNARNETFRIFDSKPANEEQRLLKGAYVRQMVGYYAVQRMQIGRLTKQLADRTAELESLKNPAPQPPKRGGGGGQVEAADEDWATRAKRELLP